MDLAFAAPSFLTALTPLVPLAPQLAVSRTDDDLQVWNAWQGVSVCVSLAGSTVRILGVIRCPGLAGEICRPLAWKGWLGWG